MTLTKTPKHIETSLRLLDEAQRRFDDDDLCGACEKGIKAMNGYLKAVAKQRGWASESEIDLHDVAMDLAFETDDPGESMTQHLAAEGGLDIAFYGEQHSSWMVEGGLRSVRKFLALLESRNKPQRKVRLSQIERERQRKWRLEQNKKSAKFRESRKRVSLFERYLKSLDE